MSPRAPLLLALLATVVAAAPALTQPRHVDESAIRRVRAEVRRSPTARADLRPRHEALIAWARSLLDRGFPVGRVFSRQEAMRLRELVRRDEHERACRLVDQAFEGLELLVEREEALRDAAPPKKAEPRQARLPAKAAGVEVVRALPKARSGAAVRGRPRFKRTRLRAGGGSVTVKLDDEPVWVIEGKPPKGSALPPERSPFGFHPASALEMGYRYAREIGVVWDRGGLYLMWVLCQPDPEENRYDWKQFDRYFRDLAKGMLPLKNITVAHDGMVRNRGRLSLRAMKRGKLRIDVSEHVEGTSYRPTDTEAYGRWVRAAVERYDGDGKGDMPGLRIPAKHWQVDNEPPRGREGYADLVRITYKAVKGADPGAKVLIGGLMFLPVDEQVFRYEKDYLPILRELDGEGFDIFDLHWFGTAGEWRRFPKVIARVREDLKDCGFRDVPIWITEMGTYTGRPKGGPFRRLHRQSERDQASELVKRHVVALGEGVEKVFWAWGMREGFKNPGSNEFFENTGFVYDGLGPGDPGRGVKKIAYWTYGNMTRRLKHWDGDPPERLRTGPGVVAYRFRYPGTDRGVIAAWLAAD